MTIVQSPVPLGWGVLLSYCHYYFNTVNIIYVRNSRAQKAARHVGNGANILRVAIWQYDNPTMQLITLQPKGVKQYPFRRRIIARPLPLLLAWLYLTLLAVGLCENGNFQTEGGGRALDLVVWSRLGSQTIFLFTPEVATNVAWLFDYMTIKYGTIRKCYHCPTVLE